MQRERHTDYPPRQAKVTVCEWEDGRIEIRYQGKARPHHEIAPPRPAPVEIAVAKPPRPSGWKPKNQLVREEEKGDIFKVG